VDAQANKANLEKMVAEAQKAEQERKKAAADTAAFEKYQHELVIDSYKNKSLKEIQIAIATLTAKKKLTVQQTEDLRKLRADEANILEIMERNRIDTIKRSNSQIIQAELDRLAAKGPLNARELKEQEELSRAIVEAKKHEAEQRLKAEESILSSLESLSHSHNSAIAAIGKAAAIARATVNIKEAYTKALAIEGPWGFAAAGAVLAAGAVQIGEMAATSTGFEQGGMIPGSSTTGDKQFVRANAGELILNRAQQTSLAAQLASQGGETESTVYIDGIPFLKFLNRVFRDGRLTVPAAAVQGA
jgi:hypothetical protein